MLQMKQSEVLMAGSCGVAKFFDASHDKFCRERGGVMIQRVVVQELTSHTTCIRIRSVLNYCRELFTESFNYDILVGVFVLVEGYGLVWCIWVFSLSLCR